MKTLVEVTSTNSEAVRVKWDSKRGGDVLSIKSNTAAQQLSWRLPAEHGEGELHGMGAGLHELTFRSESKHGNLIWEDSCEALCFDCSQLRARVTLLTDSSATLAWDPIPYASMYHIEVNDGAQWQEREKTSGEFCVVSRLPTGVASLVRIRPAAASMADAIGMVLAIVPLRPVTNIAVNSCAASTAELSWTASAGSTCFSVRYRSANSPVSWDSILPAVTTQPACTLYGLIPNTELEVQVLAGFRRVVSAASCSSRDGMKIVSAGLDSVRVGWPKAKTAKHYRIEAKMTSGSLSDGKENEGGWAWVCHETSNEALIRNLVPNSPVLVRVSPASSAFVHNAKPNDFQAAGPAIFGEVRVRHHKGRGTMEGANQDMVFESRGSEHKFRTRHVVHVVSLTDSAATIAWDHGGNSNFYKITKNIGIASMTWTVSTPEVTAKSLRPGQVHRFTVESSENQTGPFQAVGSIELVPTGPPQGAIVREVTATSARLQWSISEPNTSFLVERRTDASRDFGDAIEGQGLTGVDVCGLSPDTNYEFRVRCRMFGAYETEGTTVSTTTLSASAQEAKVLASGPPASIAFKIGRPAKFRIIKKQAGLPDEVRIVDANNLQLDTLMPGAHYDIQLVESSTVPEESVDGRPRASSMTTATTTTTTTVIKRVGTVSASPGGFLVNNPWNQNLLQLFNRHQSPDRTITVGQFRTIAKSLNIDDDAVLKGSNYRNDSRTLTFNDFVNELMPKAAQLALEKQQRNSQ